MSNVPRAVVAEHHDEAQPLPGRDLSGLIIGSATPESVASPLYFMTEDDISRGLSTQNILTGEAYPPVDVPCYIESTIAMLPTGADGAEELWKLNHYYERLDDWNEAHGIPKNPFVGPPAEPVFELAQPHDGPRRAPQPRRRRQRHPEPDAVRARHSTRRQAQPSGTPQPDRLTFRGSTAYGGSP